MPQVCRVRQLLSVGTHWSSTLCVAAADAERLVSSPAISRAERWELRQRKDRRCSTFCRLARHRGDAEHVTLHRLLVGADDFHRERVIAGGQFVLAQREGRRDHVGIVVKIDRLADLLAVESRTARCRSRGPWSTRGSTCCLPAVLTRKPTFSLSPGLAPVHQICFVVQPFSRSETGQVLRVGRSAAGLDQHGCPLTTIGGMS